MTEEDVRRVRAKNQALFRTFVLPTIVATFVISLAFAIWGHGGFERGGFYQTDTPYQGFGDRLCGGTMCGWPIVAFANYWIVKARNRS